MYFIKKTDGGDNFPSTNKYPRNKNAKIAEKLIMIISRNSLTIIIISRKEQK